jgi:hypothetical protein
MTFEFGISDGVNFVSIVRDELPLGCSYFRVVGSITEAIECLEVFGISRATVVGILKKEDAA